MPKRSTKQNRRYNRRRTYKARPRRNLRYNTGGFFSTTRLFESTAVTVSNAGAVSNAYSFNILQMPDVSDFTALFDQYKLNGIEVTFIPNITSNDANPVSTYYELPNVHTIIDRDDDSAPGALTNFMQYPSYKRTRGHMVHKRYWRPAIAQTIYKTSSTTGTSQRGPTWLDLADTTLPHFGLKLYIDQTNAATNIKYRMYVKYFLQFKGVR